MTNNQANQDWTRAELLKFPKLSPYLKSQEKKQKELYRHLLIVSNEKRQSEIEEQLKKLDVEINLKRVLRNDQRYMNIGRDRSKWNFFEPSVMNRIFREASKIARSNSTNRGGGSGGGHFMDKKHEHDEIINDPNSNSLYMGDKRRLRSKVAKARETNNSRNCIGNVKLPSIIMFKKSEDSDIVTHRLELEQFVDLTKKNQKARSDSKIGESNASSRLSTISTSVCILRPKYQHVKHSNMNLSKSQN
jgi:hypothetical protein